jgi:hypothetical protein
VQRSTTPPAEAFAALCIPRLREALNPATAVFDRQIRGGRWEATRGTEDLTSTAIVLIGTSRAGLAPAEIGMDLEQTRAAMLDLARRRRYAGGLGIVLWANAATGGPPLAEVLRRVGQSLDDVAGLTAPLQTMEVAWLVSGLAHELHRSGGDEVRGPFEAAVAALKERFLPAVGIFGHATAAARLTRRIRRWVANFADQIYSIQALALAAIAAEDGPALELAGRAAGRIVELQGDLGQWWWHYDARTGAVCQSYPVYSVHQHGMAPMALRTLAAAGGPGFDTAIEKSFAWLDRNELGISLVDPAAGTIWRDIEPAEGRGRRAFRHLRSILGRGRPDPPHATSLTINRETRPYEWAWCLFAAALDGRGESMPRTHLV